MKEKYKNKAENIIPVLLGADLNCYNVARAFHEKYGVISHAFGRYPIGATQNTRIINFTTVEKIDEHDTFVKTLNDFADKHAGSSLILMGCTDDYATMIIKHKNELSDRFITPCIDAPLMEDITLKERFYEYCDKYNIPYPKTVVLSKGEALTLNGFGYPIIIKPSSSVLYWKYPFDGMKKVYSANSREEAESIISEIYSSGYPDKLIIQDMIPGNDSFMYTMTAYCDKNSKVRMMCLGHVLLEEHTPKGLGNHAAIVTEYNRPLMDVLKNFLEEIGYVGFANFDIKYDSRDGSYRVFEINVRQGRSNFYVTAAGCNIAEYVVRDYILSEEFDGCYYCDKESYWSYLPTKLVLSYADADMKNRIKRLIKSGCGSSSMRYKIDTCFNPKRAVFIFLHEKNQIKKFNRYYPIPR